MRKMKIGITDTAVSLLSNSNYYKALIALIANAQTRIYINLFIIDMFENDSDNTIVTELLGKVSDAFKRGVYTRLIIGSSKTNINIQDINESTFKYCSKINIPTELMSLRKGYTSHKKVVVIDNSTIIGSHNWSLGAFTNQTQDSVLINDERMASYFAFEIGQDWLKLRTQK